MRQFADGWLPGATQRTPSSDIAAAPMTPNSPVCLPLVSESKKLIWVHSDQIDLQLNGAAELDKAFDRFPYLTHEQTAALAQRCSLHPDQVRVWFMAQRLRHGISWDYHDIREVWSKFQSSQGGAEGPEEMENGMEGDEKQKETENTTECGGKKAKESKIIGQDVTVTDKLEEMKKEENRSVEGDKRKRKRMAAMEKMGQKKTKGITERATKVEAKSDKDESKGQKRVKSEGAGKKKSGRKRQISTQERPAHNVPAGADSLLCLQPADNSPDVLLTPVSGGLQGETPGPSGLMGDLLIDAANRSVLVSDASELNELAEGNIVGDDLPAVARQQSSGGEHAAPRRYRCNAKTHSQLTMLRVAFLRCQYPDSEQYRQLVAVIGVPRHVLVQWYGDMRYYIKRSMPRWMNEEQHRQVLASVRYRQYVSALAKEQQRPTSGEAMALEGKESAAPSLR